MDNKDCLTENSRWNSYGTYKLMLWIWMLNEAAVVFSPVEISIDGFYLHGCIQLISIIFVGIPLVYTEICIAQYTNCDIVSKWNFLPILRGVGYGTYYLLFLKSIYLKVLTSWYLEYTFYSIRDPPPWFSCDEFNSTKCMIKRVDVSVFQHCIEAQQLYDTDCGMRTGSNYFYERVIGSINTKKSNCVNMWEVIIANCTTGVAIFILSIKREKIIQTIVKLVAFYLCIMIFILFWVTLSSTGTWYATKITLYWYNYEITTCISSFTRGILSCSAGYGIITFLSRDISFRSPATMTSVTIPLCSYFITIQLALIIFGGIKTMSYYHGEEENILEVGESYFFSIFATTTETLMYFDQLSIWAIIWLSGIFCSLFINLWILYLFFQDTMFNTIKLAQKYDMLSSFLLIQLISILSCPFYCCDLTKVINDAVDILQLTNIFIFSSAVYWVYGFKNHSVDITFMIGVKPSMYWKISWVLSPIFIIVTLSDKWPRALEKEYNNSYYIQSIKMSCDELLLYILISGYFVIIFISIIIEIKNYYYNDQITNLFKPTANWGPRDQILFRSRQMFVPEIMTREFLYRQIRIRGYKKKTFPFEFKEEEEAKSHKSLKEDVEWNAFTSN